MEHTRTTPEQSVILKKIGYDVPDTHYWLQHLTQGWIEETGYAGEQLDYNNEYSFTYTRPKLTDVATWLREVKGWHVYADSSREWCTWYPVCVPKGGSFDTGTEGFDTHDLALSAGIYFILTKLNEDA
jgi:hypothetical protein